MGSAPNASPSASSAKASPAKPSSTKPATAAAPAPASRIASLDTLRGFDMFWIIGGHGLLLTLLGLFVAPPEWLKTQMGHAQWEGFTAWDLIMPLFLFVVGAAMPLAFVRRWQRGDSLGSVYRRGFSIEPRRRRLRSTSQRSTHSSSGSTTRRYSRC